MIKFTIRILIIAGVILLALQVFRFSLSRGELEVGFRDRARIENLRKVATGVKEKVLSRLVGIWTVHNKEAKDKTPSETVKKEPETTEEQISEDDRKELEKIIEEKIE
ncbi:MAG: hypothetical protein JSU92_09400 [Deltaproteobacteria bacterium]|nr:MAG: hypothetical protein JSU92_09400 [Deltaproteobacteria bacterium]